jgi:hypothetical protein
VPTDIQEKLEDLDAIPCPVVHAYDTGTGVRHVSSPLALIGILAQTLTPRAALRNIFYKLTQKMKQIAVWKSGYEQIEVDFNGYGQMEVDFNIFSNAITRSTRRHGTKPTLRYVNIPSLFSKGLTDATEEVFVVEGDSLNYNTAREP